MVTGSKNNKSQHTSARVPHDVIDRMEQVKYENETTGQFIVESMKREIKRREEEAKK